MLERCQCGKRSSPKTPQPTGTTDGQPRPIGNNKVFGRIKKLTTPRLRVGEKVDARAFSLDDPPTTYANDTTIECDGTPTEEWLRRQALASIKRPLSQTEQEELYTQDKDYRGDHKHHTNLPSQPLLITEENTIAWQIDRSENALDNQHPQQTTEEDNYGTTKTSIFPSDFPASLNSIKKYVAEKDGETYIPFHSTIVLKKRRRMLYLPLEFGEITRDGLVDSGAFINAMSWSDYNAIKMNSDICVIKECPY